MLAQFVVNKLTGVAVCAAAIVFYFGGTMTLTNCLLMLICSFILFEQLDSAGSFSSLFRSIDIGVDKANAILNVVPMDIDGEDLTPEREDIALSHVDFSYDSKPILHDVSLTIPEKTTVAIVGPSGSGKTTLCNLMARFWDVQSGSVRLGGRDVREYSYDSLIRNFSFVFQRTYLFSDTIANNIRFAQVVLLHQPCFIERQVEEVDMIVTLDPAVTGTGTGFFPADRAFHKEDIAFFSFTFHLFITEEMDDFFGFLLNRFVFRIFGTNVAQIFAIADYLFIPYGNIAGSFVSDMYIVMLFTQTMECTAHRNYIVIRMRTEDNHFLRIRSCTFGTV